MFLNHIPTRDKEHLPAEQILQLDRLGTLYELCMSMLVEEIHLLIESVLDH